MPHLAERKPDEGALPVASDPAALRAHIAAWRAAGDTVALVPTMGALHAGHDALVMAGRASARRVVVSIFVNPTQFSPAEDLDRYPRTFEADYTMLGRAGVDLVYAPAASAMYPAGFATSIAVGGPATVGLEDEARPHFFGGVATVVAKLLTQCRPDVAMFGEKDYQQLRVVTVLARDLDLAAEIVAVPTVREGDGMALSSRNRFLSADERKRATVIVTALEQAAAAMRGGTAIDAALARGRDMILGQGFGLDYFEARNALTLEPPGNATAEPLRLLVAARVGSVRLIDNVPV